MVAFVVQNPSLYNYYSIEVARVKQCKQSKHGKTKCTETNLRVPKARDRGAIDAEMVGEFSPVCGRVVGLSREWFLRATALYVIAPVCYGNSVSSSVTRVDCIKTDEHVVEILSLSDRPIILVFRHQGLLRKSDGFIPNGGAEY